MQHLNKKVSVYMASKSITLNIQFCLVEESKIGPIFERRSVLQMDPTMLKFSLRERPTGDYATYREKHMCN